MKKLVAILFSMTTILVLQSSAIAETCPNPADFNVVLKDEYIFNKYYFYGYTITGKASAKMNATFSKVDITGGKKVKDLAPKQVSFYKASTAINYSLGLYCEYKLHMKDGRVLEMRMNGYDKKHIGFVTPNQWHSTREKHTTEKIVSCFSNNVADCEFTAN